MDLLETGIEVLISVHRELAVSCAERCVLLTQVGLDRSADLARVEENVHVSVVRELQYLLKRFD